MQVLMLTSQRHGFGLAWNRVRSFTSTAPKTNRSISSAAPMPKSLRSFTLTTLLPLALQSGNQSNLLRLVHRAFERPTTKRKAKARASDNCCNCDRFGLTRRGGWGLAREKCDGCLGGDGGMAAPSTSSVWTYGDDDDTLSG